MPRRRVEAYARSIAVKPTVGDTALVVQMHVNLRLFWLGIGEAELQSHMPLMMLSYVLNGAVFVLLCLQLRRMLTGVDHFVPLELALYALVLWALLMVLRIVWVWTSAHLRFRLRWGWSGGSSGPNPKRLLLVSWAGVRGSITLATALSIPTVVATGTLFPERDLVSSSSVDRG